VREGERERESVCVSNLNFCQFKDEGYISPSSQNTMTASCVNNGGQPLGIEVWEMALAVDLPMRRTWEAVGCLDPPKEKPFFTESGVDCVQKCWRVSRSHMLMNMSVAECMGFRNISRKQLIQDLKLLLIGVPSQTFQYNQVWCKTGQHKFQAPVLYNAYNFHDGA
jgi:hypothetical protein